jgi:hypothetical protein
VDKGYHNEGIAQCLLNNITTIVASCQNKQRKRHATDYLVAHNTTNPTIYTCPQGETLKLQEDGIKKVCTEQSGINLKNTAPSLPENVL